MNTYLVDFGLVDFDDDDNKRTELRTRLQSAGTGHIHN
jgi:hypothetical protein